MVTDAQSHLEQFGQDLQQEVFSKAGSETEPQMREDAFTEYVLEMLNEYGTADGADVCYHATGGRGPLPAAKVNAWALSSDGATLDLFIALYHGTAAPTVVPRSEVAEQFKLLRGFLRRARDGYHAKMEESHEAFEAARRICEAKDTLTTVRLFLLTDGAVKSMSVDEEDVSGVAVEYVLWDLEKLSRLRVGQREAINLDLSAEFGGAVPCLKMAAANGEYTTYLAFLGAPVLAQIYGKHGQRLLERNVRAFLQAKGKINKGLQQTLREQPHRFLAYNNGLCCTASDVAIEHSSGRTMLTRVNDFQIVNGGQTTASLFHAMIKERVSIADVVVQVKLTVLNDLARMADIVPLISKYANSQNKVNGADLSASGAFHRHLETLSRTVWTPPVSGTDRGSHWYYERARGSYLDDKGRQGTKSKQNEWSDNNPPERKFTKTDMAKYEHAWTGLPHLVCRGAEKNFIAFAERLEDDGEPTVDQDYFKQVVAKAILFRAAEKLFASLDLEGYRAQSIAYAVAWMARRSNHRIDLERIWGEQRVPVATQDCLRDVCASANEHLHRTGGNVGEWSKRPECWDRFREADIEVDRAWESEWSNKVFVLPTNSLDTIAGDWELIRTQYTDDQRTIRELEVRTGLTWLARHGDEKIKDFAIRPWSDLRGPGGRRMKRLSELVKMLTMAAKLDGGLLDVTDDTAIVGRDLRIIDLSTGAELMVRIVAGAEHGLSGDGFEAFSQHGPVGRALFGRRVGETVRGHSPGGPFEYRIEGVQ